jgi:hypothetical protein
LSNAVAERSRNLLHRISEGRGAARKPLGFAEMLIAKQENVGGRVRRVVPRQQAIERDEQKTNEKERRRFPRRPFRLPF